MINNLDHMRISGSEPSSVILSQTKKFELEIKDTTESNTSASYLD